MKIGLSTSSIERGINRGIVDGIGHYTAQIYENLTNRGHTVCPYAFPRFLKDTRFENSQALPRSYITQLTASSLRLLKPVSVDVDVFHSTDYKVVPMSCPVVATIWDAIVFVHPEWLEWLRNGLRRALAPRLLRQSAQYADRVISVSNHAASDLVKYFKIPEERLRVVPWSISKNWLTKYDSAKIKDIQEKYNISGEYVLTVGTLQPRKNFSRLIDAFLKLPKNSKKDLKLLIVGKSGWGNDDLLEKINMNSDKVIHLNNVNDDVELQCIYQGARVFAFPSLYEGFGMPVLEAFASEIPVVASNATSVPEVAGDAAFLIDPFSTDALSSALNEVLSTPGLASSMVKKGRERLSLFSEEAMIEETIKVYKEVT